MLNNLLYIICKYVKYRMLTILKKWRKFCHYHINEPEEQHAKLNKSDIETQTLTYLHSKTSELMKVLNIWS